MFGDNQSVVTSSTIPWIKTPCLPHHHLQYFVLYSISFSISAFPWIDPFPFRLQYYYSNCALPYLTEVANVQQCRTTYGVPYLLVSRDDSSIFFTQKCAHDFSSWSTLPFDCFDWSHFQTGARFVIEHKRSSIHRIVRFEVRLTTLKASKHG